MKKTAPSLLFVCLAAFAGASYAQSPTPVVVNPVEFKPVLQALTPMFSSLRGDTEPHLPLYELEDPERSDLIAGMNVATVTPSLVTADSRTTFQTSLGTLPVTVTKSIAGLGNGYNASWVNQGLLPPDTNMAVGPNHLVQWVNVRLTVMDKNGTPLVGGPLGYINGNQIWSSLGPTSVCATSNQGDPLAVYDRASDRFVLSQFAFTLATATNGVRYPGVGTYRQCIAVSTTNDPTGTYNLYEYAFTNFPDYGKIGVWPDGYYMTFNNFAYNTATGSGSFAGASTCAFDRTKMLTGAAASAICFNYTNNQPFFAILPADMDGISPPPAGAPNYQISPDWFFLNNPPYSVQLQKFHVDFATPANSTLTDGLGGAAGSFVKMPMPDAIGACGDGGGTCVAQPGTARVLDTLSMRFMYPLKYHNRGPGAESLVFTQTIDPPGTATAGINWLEIRNPGANPPVIRQNGAITPTGDTINRWMGAANMDKQGNIAIGYSASGTTLSPSIRVAGRLNPDILGRVRGEMQVVAGTGAQTSTAQRWGDYSALQLDPADNCTFWYTQEYTNSTSAANWATRIVAFKFNGCN